MLNSSGSEADSDHKVLPGIGDDEFEHMMKDFNPDEASDKPDEEPEEAPAEPDDLKHHEDAELPALEGREDDELEPGLDDLVDEDDHLDHPVERRKLREEAASLLHLLTHLSKNPYCVSCQRAKMRQRYSHRGAFKREPDQFGEIITCDHVVTPSMRMQGLGG
jgi:hypothetical protein